MYRLNSYFWIEELSSDQGTTCNQSSICRSKKYSIFRSKDYLQVKELTADWRIICRSNNYFQIKTLPTDQKTKSNQTAICRLKNYVLNEEVFHLQIKKLSANGRIICRSNFNLHMEEISPDQGIKNYLQIFNLLKSTFYITYR